MDLPDPVIDTLRYVTPMPAGAIHNSCEVLVIGAGAAGLAAALAAAEHAEVTLLARGALAASNSAWAQGGIAAALDESDEPALHVADTLTAGAGLSDRAAVELLANEAPALMHELAALGVPFEAHGHGFALGLEGGHGKRRILHVGDTTGWAITSTLLRHVLAHPRIRVLEGYQALELLTAPDEDRCTGAMAQDSSGRVHCFAAGAVVLASGGAGALYGFTSNQPSALGEGVAIAYRAGAEVADMEFVQFHPTVYRTSSGAGFLISEATRGEGGMLLSTAGERFMPAYDPRAELAPRDVVTRGIYAAMRRESADHVLLDLTGLGRVLLEQRFPTIVARCRAEGLDPADVPIPVAPAAHYLMGGVRTDLDGATSLPGLFAAGECACTGVHGANRLASNSLLECLVFGRRAGRAASLNAEGRTLNAEGRTLNAEGRTLNAESQRLKAPAAPLQSRLPETAPAVVEQLDRLASIMRAHAGPLRDGPGLTRALPSLEQLDAPIASAFSVQRSAFLTARLIVNGALLRCESRGAHFRADYPRTEEAWRGHIVQARGQAPRMVECLADGVAAAVMA
jgi:L-aspartate oxidase